jgi:hypothetical protein
MDFLPGKPFSLDNYRSLLSDSLCREDGCERLGLQPASFRAWTPLWLSPKSISSPHPVRSRRGRRCATAWHNARRAPGSRLSFLTAA